ncbi:hypothetical protein [Mycobacterium sp. SMC-4]|uniref:hypothetical protein n=1 Tax=Mycobacterium sp. SMC-4 TaxID=2857059 RepID=UPI0021B1EA6A|nr:hypothetical protein [Mycobacterium sp. SMC-4]UXA21163.1 hypothetical protein KXD98_26730 [Mycobacterium sp. SMC-4]
MTALAWAVGGTGVVFTVWEMVRHLRAAAQHLQDCTSASESTDVVVGEVGSVPVRR